MRQRPTNLLLLCAMSTAPLALSSMSYGAAPISGSIPNASGTVVALVGTTTKTAVVASNGTYTLPAVPPGSYTLQPKDANHVFTPVALFKRMGTGAINNVNFSGAATTAATYKIAGTLYGDYPAGSQVTLNGANVGSVSIDSGGSYSFQGLAAGIYTVSASNAGMGFAKSITISLKNQDSLHNYIKSTATPSGQTLTVSAVATLPPATVGIVYSTSVLKSISGGTGPYHYQSGVYAAGTPPLGMIVTATGLLTGTPTKAGTYNFTLCAADDHGVVSTVCAPTSIVVGTSGTTAVAPPVTTPPVTTPPVTTPPVTTPPVTTPVAAGTSWVYYNGVFDWPGDFSFAADANYADTSGVPLSGPHDIKMTTSAYGGWLPYALNWDFDDSPYTKLTFSLKPTESGQSWTVYFVKVGDIPVGVSIDVADYGPAPVAGKWATYTVPLSALGVSGTSIYKFAIQDKSGNNGNTWYIDNVGFVK
jgi:hypothetical protein